MAAARGRSTSSSWTRCASGRTRRTSRSTQAVAAARRIGAGRTFFTHMAHDLGHAATCARLPDGDGAGPRRPDARRSRKAAPVGDVIFYPDDPRPATWRRPIVALGNFDGLHRGHQKIVERVCRQAREQGATRGGHDVRPAPAAHRPAGQGAAAADDQRAAGRGAPQGGHRRRRLRALHPRDVAVGAGAVRPGRDRRLAAPGRSVGRRQLPVRPRPLGQLLAAALARPALRLPRRADRPGALPRLRRQQHPRPPADRPRDGSTRRPPSSGTTTSWTARWWPGPAGAARSASRPPT